MQCSVSVQQGAVSLLKQRKEECNRRRHTAWAMQPWDCDLLTCKGEIIWIWVTLILRC